MWAWLFLLAPALAARHELTFEAGTTVISDPAASTWFGAGGEPQLGLRIGGAVLQHPTGFGLVVGGAWGRQAQAGYVTPSYSTLDGEYLQSDIRTRLLVDRFGLGLRADYDVRGVFFPLVRAEARLALVSWRLDESELGLRGAGVAPGGRFTGGFEVMIPDRALPVTVGFTLEAGYEIDAPAKLGQLGTIDPSGPVVTAGGGLRL
ncbi:MAG TPA: hypothetical protein PKA64_02285 [Myxococcota bacterium]|nr:hypothetical protein [Myxococcota bacterium]